MLKLVAPGKRPANSRSHFNTQIRQSNYSLFMLVELLPLSCRLVKKRLSKNDTHIVCDIGYAP